MENDQGIITQEDIENLKKVTDSSGFVEWFRAVHSRELKKAFTQAYTQSPQDIALSQIEMNGEASTLSDYGFDSDTPVWFRDDVCSIAASSVEKDRAERPDYKFDTFDKILEEQLPWMWKTVFEEMDRRRAAFDDAMGLNEKRGED